MCVCVCGGINHKSIPEAAASSLHATVGGGGRGFKIMFNVPPAHPFPLCGASFLVERPFKIHESLEEYTITRVSAC